METDLDEQSSDQPTNQETDRPTDLPVNRLTTRTIHGSLVPRSADFNDKNGLLLAVIL